MAFPLFVLAVGIAAGLGNSVSSVIIATAIATFRSIFWRDRPRADVNRRRSAAYVGRQASRASRRCNRGAPHQCPSRAPPLMVPYRSLNMGWAILNAAGLSFIGSVRHTAARMMAFHGIGGTAPPYILFSGGGGWIFCSCFRRAIA